MGEYADYEIDRMFDDMDRLDDENLYGEFDEPMDGETRYRSRVAELNAKTKTCRFCGMNGLVWRNMGATGWRLASPDGKVHVCDRHPRAASVAKMDDVNHELTQRHDANGV